MHINALFPSAFHAADPVPSHLEAASSWERKLRDVIGARTGDRKAECFHLNLAKKVFLS